MEIKIVIVPAAPDTYALELHLGDPEGAAGLVNEVRLQEDYRTPRQALMALVECLTFAPPDLTVYEEAVGQVAQLVDGVQNLNEAMTQVGERLTQCEDAVQQIMPTPVARVNPLLAGRRTVTVVSTAGQGVPPSIRSNRPEIPHRATGGVMRGRGTGMLPQIQEDE